MEDNYEAKRELPEYLDVDEFFRNPDRTVSIGRDVREQVRREEDARIGMDPDVRRYNEDLGYLANRPI